MNQDVSQNVDRLARVLGFDPAKKGGGGVFQEALDAVNKKRAEASREKAITLIETAITLREQMSVAESQFNAQKKKFDKELGKLVARIEALSQGKSPSQAEAEALDQEQAEKSGD